MKVISVLIASLILAIVVPAWAQNLAGPSARHLRLEWETAQTKKGRPIVSGYVYNDYGQAAGNVRLLVEELDPAGRPVAATMGYVNGDLAPGVRGYFEIPVARREATYRVTVQAFDWRPRGP